METLREAARIKPDDAEVHFRLGTAYAQLGRWGEAIAAYDRGVELDPTNYDRWCLAAALHAGAGDVEGYRRTCRGMLKRFGATDHAQPAERITKACLLLPDALSAADFERVQQLAGLAVTGTEKDGYYHFFMMSKGLADHRAGRYAEAVKCLERFPANADGTHWDATKLAVLALAHYRLGDTKEAEAALAKSKAILAQKMPDPAKGRLFGDRDWHDWLHAQILCREAEALLKNESGVRNQESEKK